MEQTANTVSFPGLGLDFEVNRVAFSIGDLPVYWYGILIALGFILAILYVSRRAREFGVDADRMLDVILGGAIGGIVGARAYYVILQWDYYGQNLSQIFNTRSGGMAIYGGLIGGVLIGLLMCKIRRVKFMPALDLVVGGFLIGQGIGRWANFVNQEAFGTNTDLPWGMISEGTVNYLVGVQSTLAAEGVTVDPLQPVHPTFLYESLWCLAGFVVLALLIKRRKFNGQLFLGYIIWYGIGRFWIEGLRTDALMVNDTLRTSQLVALVSVLAAFILMVLGLLRARGKTLMVPLAVADLKKLKETGGAFPVEDLPASAPHKEFARATAEMNRRLADWKPEDAAGSEEDAGADATAEEAAPAEADLPAAQQPEAAEETPDAAPQAEPETPDEETTSAPAEPDGGEQEKKEDAEDAGKAD